MLGAEPGQHQVSLKLGEDSTKETKELGLRVNVQFESSQRFPDKVPEQLQLRDVPYPEADGHQPAKFNVLKLLELELN